MIVEVFTGTDEVVALQFQILADEFRAIASRPVFIEGDKRHFLRQPVHIQRCRREVSQHLILVETFACQPHVVEFEERLRLALMSFNPPSPIAAGRNGEHAVFSNHYRHRDRNARCVALARCRYLFAIAREIDLAPVPCAYNSRKFIHSARHILHHLAYAQRARPPVVGIKQPVALLARHSVIAAHGNLWVGAVALIVAGRTVGSPPRQVACLKRGVRDEPRGIHGVLLAGTKQLAAVVVGIIRHRLQSCHHAEHGQ